jgi:hypothetical protein
MAVQQMRGKQIHELKRLQTLVLPQQQLASQVELAAQVK